jgi:hypothetical protein
MSSSDAAVVDETNATVITMAPGTKRTSESLVQPYSQENYEGLSPRLSTKKMKENQDDNGE